MKRLAGIEKPVDAGFVARPAKTVNFDQEKRDYGNKATEYPNPLGR
jgi:hypothetical protein